MIEILKTFQYSNEVLFPEYSFTYCYELSFF